MSKIACVTVGRSADAAITIPHETVSRLHAEVIPLSDGRVYITDCASRNGTFICDDGADGQWREISQDFADAGARVRTQTPSTPITNARLTISSVLLRPGWPCAKPGAGRFREGRKPVTSAVSDRGRAVSGRKSRRARGSSC